MEWMDIKLIVGIEDLQKASDIATMVAGAGIYVEDYSDLEEGAREIARIDLIDEELLKKDRTIAIVHLYLSKEESPAEILSFINNRLTSENVKAEILVDDIKEEDWANGWKKYYHAFSLTEKLAICPSWEEYTASPNQHVITLDPGMAFGTGTHDTTQLCLLLLEKHLKAGKNLLDIGTGSGILAIAGKMLGSGRTVGVDIDPVAVRVAKENAEINNVEAEFSCSDLVEGEIGKFDVITANIVADVIIRLSSSLPALLNEDGIFIASGIIDTRKDDVIDAILSLGFKLIEIKEQKGWVAVAFSL